MKSENALDENCGPPSELARFDRDTYGDEVLPQYFDDILRIGIMPVPDYETGPARQTSRIYKVKITSMG